MALGNMNENLAFEYGDGTRAYAGCGATLNGEFWYFGGQGSKWNVSFSPVDYRFYNLCFTFFQTVSKIVGCQLVRQPDMDFYLTWPACNTFLEPTSKVLLCFHDQDEKLCHS